MITNLAQFKRALTLGSLWEATNYLVPDKAHVFGVRPVSIVKTNKVAFRTPDGRDSWHNFATADCYEFINGDTVLIYWPEVKAGNSQSFDSPRKLIMQYKLIKQSEVA